MNSSTAVEFLERPASETKEAAPVAAGPLLWRAWLGLIALPALCMALGIYCFGVNIPHFDAWTGMAPLFEAAQAGTLSFGTFFAQHNEHRIFVPRLIFYVVESLTHWNTRLEMGMTWLVFLGVSANLWMLLKATGWRARGATYGLFFAMALLCFTRMQDQNLFMGFQFSFVLPVVTFTAACWTAIGLRRPWNFVAVAVLNTLSTFTIVSGFVCWVLTVPLLLMPRGRVEFRGCERWWAGWSAAFVLNVLGYFVGFHQLREHPGAWTMLHHSGKIAEYFFNYFGAPFAFGTPFPIGDVAPIFGFCLVALLGAAVVCTWRWRRDAAFLRVALPWLMVAGFAIANGMLTTLGRARFGPAQAFESRYVAYAIVLPIALLPLGMLIHRQLARTRSPWRVGSGPVLIALAAMVLMQHTLGEFKRLEAWPIIKHFRLMNKACVQMVNCVDEPELFAFVTPSVPAFRRTANVLDQLGMLTPPILHTAKIAEVGDPRDAGDLGHGEIAIIERSASQMTLAGWAILPDRVEAADAVLLTYDAADGTPTIFALVQIDLYRPEVVEKTGEPALYMSGWKRTVSAAKFPAGAGAIKAWAYDAELRRAFRAAGSAAFVTP